VLNVKSSLRQMLAGALLVTAVVGVSAQGQGNPAASVGTRVAVIDIAKIFDEHPGFKQQMEQMKKEVEAVEAGFRQRAKQMEALRERMKQFAPGAPEYKDLDSQILNIQADGQVEATQKKKEFLEREAQLYFSVYSEIQAEVAAFSRQNSIGLVLRFNSSPIEPNRNSTLEGVNRPVVFQDRLNITTQILDQINRRYAARSAAKDATSPTGNTYQR
jgi:outer membrane protein